MKIISFYNHKGGTGKSSVVLAIAKQLQQKNKKVLVVDLDTDGCLTKNIITEEDIDFDLADYFYNDKVQIDSIVKETLLENLYIVPVKSLTSGGLLHKWIIKEASKRPNEIIRFRMDLRKLDFDYVLIDMAPSLSILDKQVFTISNEIIPILIMKKYYIQVFNAFTVLDTEFSSKIHIVVFNKLKKVKASLEEDIENLNYDKFFIPHDEFLETAIKKQILLKEWDSINQNTIKVIDDICSCILN